MEDFFEKQPLWKGMGIIVSLDSVFYFLGFRDSYYIAVISFVMALLLSHLYYDTRMKILEEK